MIAAHAPSASNGNFPRRFSRRSTRRRLSAPTSRHAFAGSLRGGAMRTAPFSPQPSAKVCRIPFDKKSPSKIFAGSSAKVCRIPFDKKSPSKFCGIVCGGAVARGKRAYAGAARKGQTVFAWLRAERANDSCLAPRGIRNRAARGERGAKRGIESGEESIY